MNMGVVFELKGRVAVVMKNDGSFVNLPANQNWRKGDVVRISRQAFKLPMGYSVAACLVLLIGVSMWSFLTPMGYVEVSVNPKVEMTVNRYSKIIGAKGLNQDGVELLSNTSLWGKNIDTGYGALLEEINNKGYFADDKELSVSVSASTQEAANRMEDRIHCMTDEQFAEMNLSCPVNMHKYPIEKYKNSAGAEIPMFIECAGSSKNEVYICLSKPIENIDKTAIRVRTIDGEELLTRVTSVKENFIVLDADGLTEGDEYTLFVDDLSTTFDGGRYMGCCIYGGSSEAL